MRKSKIFDTPINVRFKQILLNPELSLEIKELWETDTHLRASSFIAQHATAIYCQKGIQQWHGIGKGRVHPEDELAFIIRANKINKWLINVN